MKCPRRTHLFLEVELWEWKCHKHIPVLVVVNVPPIVLQVVVLLSSFLMNGAEVYAPRMMLLLAPVSASALSRSSSLLTMRLTTNLVVGWDDFSSLVLLDLNGLEEVNKYSCYSPSSLLVVKLISVERMDSAFLILIACSLFRIQLPFKCINFLKKEGQRLLFGSSFGFKVILFLLFKFVNCSAISGVVVVLVTIVTPHVEKTPNN
jgi:hypothetical protein